MLHASARFETPHGRTYLVRLCKHFAHKIDVTYSEDHAQCTLPAGPATMDADDTGVRFNVSAIDNERLANACSVIERHLERFAFREGFAGLVWEQRAG